MYLISFASFLVISNKLVGNLKIMFVFNVNNNYLKSCKQCYKIQCYKKVIKSKIIVIKMVIVFSKKIILYTVTDFTDEIHCVYSYLD